MTRQTLLAAVAAMAALTAAGGTPVASHDDHDRRESKRRFKASLRGLAEIPVVFTAARGTLQLRINRDENEIAWRLEYRNLEGAVSQAHIHVGDHHQNGGISVWFCNATAMPPSTIPVPATCPAAPQGGPPAVLTGSFMSADVAGPNAQGVAPGEFAELIRAIRAGLAYANVHSSMAAGGEIRGQIKVDD